MQVHRRATAHEPRAIILGRDFFFGRHHAIAIDAETDELLEPVERFLKAFDILSAISSF